MGTSNRRKAAGDSYQDIELGPVCRCLIVGLRYSFGIRTKGHAITRRIGCRSGDRRSLMCAVAKPR